MPDFVLGEEGSRAKLVSILEGIRSKGSSVIDQLEAARLESLVEFDRRLSSLNSRRQRANRVRTPGTLGRFVVSDLLDIDQGRSTATTRVDAQAVTLRERSDPQDSDLKSLRFTSTAGTVEKLDAKDKLYRVHTTNGQTPTGIFDIELLNPVRITLFVFDIAATPSSPDIVVEVSANGVTYTTARSVSVNGYRVTSWIDSSRVRFIRISVTPSHPDNLSGTSYTFGLTSFAADGLDFHLRSEILTKVISINPRAASFRFQADDVEGLTYFLAVGEPGDTPQFVEVKPGDVILVPGAQEVDPVSVGFVGINWTTLATDLGGTPLQAGVYVKPTTPNGFRYEVTTAGTSDLSEPTWPTTIGLTVASGTAVLTCRADGAGTPWTTVESSLDSTALTLGQMVRPTLGNGYLYEVTTAGTTATEPTWPTTLGNTVVSGGVTFTTRIDGLLNHTPPSNTYVSTMEVVEDGSGENISVASGLSFLDNLVGKLVNKYIGLVGTQMHLIRDEVALDIGKTYTVSYSAGPAEILAQLRVVLSTSDRAVSPIFHGASLEEV